MSYIIKKGWVCALPQIHFNIMNTLNKSTGFSPFQLCLGHRSRLNWLIPPLVQDQDVLALNPSELSAQTIIERIQHNVWEEQDNMIKEKFLKPKAAQQANKHWKTDFRFEVGQRVRLSTLHRWSEYKSKNEKCVVKLIPWFDGPYTITKIDNKHSIVTLDLPHSPDILPVFHTLEIMPFSKNNETLFPSCMLHTPEPVNVNNNLEYFVDKILDKRKARGHGGTCLMWASAAHGMNKSISLVMKIVICNNLSLRVNG